MLQLKQVFQDLPDFDQMSELKGEDLKAFEVQQEQEHSAAITIQNILVDEQPQQAADKGKEKVEIQLQLVQQEVVNEPVDEAAGSSHVFAMECWQTQMATQIEAVIEAYQAQVTMKMRAEEKYERLSDQMQDKIIQLVDQQTIINQLQIAYQAETKETENWRRHSQGLQQQLKEQLLVNKRHAKELEVAKIK